MTLGPEQRCTAGRCGRYASDAAKRDDRILKLTAGNYERRSVYYNALDILKCCTCVALVDCGWDGSKRVQDPPC